MFVACPPNVFPPALLFPLSLSRLFLTPSAPKPSCGSVDFRHLRLSSTLIGASEVDSSTRVSWMLLRCAATTAPTGSDRGRGVGATRNQTILSTKPPYSADGGRTYSLARKSTIHVLKSRMYNHCHMNPSTHYSSRMKPESQSSHLAQRSSPIGSLVHVLDATRYRIQQVHFTACHA